VIYYTGKSYQPITDTRYLLSICSASRECALLLQSPLRAGPFPPGARAHGLPSVGSNPAAAHARAPRRTTVISAKSGRVKGALALSSVVVSVVYADVARRNVLQTHVQVASAADGKNVSCP